MENFDVIYKIIILLVLIYIANYLKIKGANLATKEDVGDVTREVEGIKAKLEHSVFISKLQFENEFNIYKEIWNSLVDLRNATLRLRPVYEKTDSEMTEEEIKLAKLNLFVERYNDFYEVLEKNKPFYSKLVYSSLKDVTDICYSEFVDFDVLIIGDKDYWKIAIKNRKKIIELIELTCESIRNRIEEVKVI